MPAPRALQDLRVALVQGDTRWHDPEANRAYYGGLITPLRGQADLVVLPETFTSGFSNDAIARAEGMDGPTVAWLRQQAAALGAAIAGSVQIRTDAGVFNRLLFATPDGALAHYDKRHLFTFAREHERYSPGRERVVVEWKGWRILLQVCYDLRFPVFSRNRFDPAHAGLADYDLALYVANWPSARAHAWNTLLRARAIENLCYVMAPAQGGRHPSGRVTWGHTMIVDPWGEIIACRDEGPGVVLADIDPARIAEVRESLPALRHRCL